MPSAPAKALGKEHENCIFYFLHSIETDYIYTYIYRHTHINHHNYITNIHYIPQTHAYFINLSEIHHKSTKVQHHKFSITSSTSLLRRWRLQLWPPRLRWRTSLRRRVGAISRGRHGGRIVWTTNGGCTKEKRLHVLGSKLKILEVRPVHVEVSNMQETTTWWPIIATVRRSIIPMARRPKITTARRQTIPTVQTH